MFYENNWKMRDLLIYYNNLDVKPFIEAIKNMMSYYTQRGVDIFKDAISGNMIFILAFTHFITTCFWLSSYKRQFENKIKTRLKRLQRY